MVRLASALFGLSVILFTGQLVQASCNVKALAPPDARTFAALSAQKQWHEYGNVKGISELETNGGESAQFWRENDGGSSVYLVEPGEDFWTFTRYCFDGAGQLRQVSFEVRTAWGWAYGLEGSVVESVLRLDSTQFFNIKTGKQIPRPDGASDVSNALVPVLYLSIAKLPFAQLLSGPSATKQK